MFVLIDERKMIPDIAIKFGVNRTTILRLAKKRSSIEQTIAAQRPRSLKKIKQTRQSKHSKLNEAIWVWFQEMRVAKPTLPVSIEMVKIKAATFHKHFCDADDFAASNGWYEKWAGKYGVRSLKCTGQTMMAPTQEVDPFCSELMKIIRRENLGLNQIYNFDETAMFYKSVPNRSLASNNEKSVSAFRPSKDRLTVSPCANASGDHKLDLQCIGRSKKPRCFRGGLPEKITYQPSRKAWQTKTLFRIWFFEHFVPQVKSYQEKMG